MLIGGKLLTTNPTSVPTDLAKLSVQYIAGFFDGEGNIHLDYQGNELANIKCSIGQKNKTVLDRINEIYPGSIVPNGKDGCYQLQFHRESTSRLLADVLPYLIVKKFEAEIALSIMQCVGKPGTKPDLRSRVKRLKLQEAYEAYFSTTA
jgi:hypothetical protein